MIRSILLLFLSLGLASCKKKTFTPQIGPLKAVTQSYNGKEVSLFEFSATDSYLKSYTGIMTYGTGTALLKNNYQLSYKNGNLFSAVIEPNLTAIFTFNAKNKIIGTSYGSLNYSYTYDQQDRLTSMSATGYSNTFTYYPNGDLNQMITSYNGGQTIATVESGLENNPLYGIPLVYLGADVSLWTITSLSKRLILSITYTYIDNQSGGFSLKENFRYDLDQYGRPVNAKHFYDANNLIGSYIYKY